MAKLPLPSESTYSTADTALAAWLYANGFQLLKIDRSEFPSIFHFEDSSEELTQLVHDFQAGKAEGNIIIFFRAYKILLGKIKEKNNG